MNIIYEDNHIIAVNKTNSDLVQGDKTGDTSLDKKLQQFLKEKYNKPGNVFVGVVHRLDRPVSGAVIFAKTSKALSRLNNLFKNKEISKTYWAIIKNRPPKDEDTLIHYIVRNTKKNKSFAYDKEMKNSKKASLSYKLIALSDNYSLLEIDLHTGRHHQIRSQLSKIGCPIKGDLKYGFPHSNTDGGISLHATKINFIHPVKKELVTIIADTPNEKLWNLFDKIVN
ncbi:MAG: RluA family pseudouridine synthase [Bacteroidales bacterium]|jgi:23S rRNA pseudouridine1911/1915/1917 synthase|nr:RluA family pseudouridine synthase [Bacteroidales bacterium]